MATIATIIRVQIEEGNHGLFYATSPDLSGLLVSARSIEELETIVPEAIADMMIAMHNTPVLVFPAKKLDDAPLFFPWIAVNAAVVSAVGDKAMRASDNLLDLLRRIVDDKTSAEALREARDLLATFDDMRQSVQ